MVLTLASRRCPALDDVSLLPEQRAYANVNTSLADAMAAEHPNVKDARTNVFWAGMTPSVLCLSRSRPTMSFCRYEN